MIQYSTDTLPVRSKSYQDTCEAYLPSLYSNIRIDDPFPIRSYDPICKFVRPEDLGNFIAFNYLMTRGNPKIDKLLSFLVNNSAREYDYNFLTTPINDDNSNILRIFASALQNKPVEKSCNQETCLNNSKTDWIELEILNSLYNKISFKEWDKIKAFIEKRKFLTQVIIDSISVSQRIFGNNTNIEYQLERDLEGSEADKLMGYILTKFEPEKALDFLDVFDDEWYFKLNNDIKNAVSFNVIPL